MKKFFVLLKKEIKELLTPQMIIPFVLVMVVFSVFGRLASSQEKKAETTQKIVILDEDKSDLTKSLIENIRALKIDPQIYQKLNEEEFVNELKQNKEYIGLILPKGMEKKILEGQKPEIKTYSFLYGFSFISSKKYAVLSTTTSLINEYISNNLITEKIPGVKASDLKSPIEVKENVVIKDKKTQASGGAIFGYLAMQSTFVPIVLYLVIIISSQMIATAIASEKENKTLETLLSMPLNRKLIIVAKMIGAGLVAFLMAGIYLFGFRSFLSDVTASSQGAQGVEIGLAVKELGLFMTPLGFFLLGTSLFLGILCALAISIVLGAFAKDIKSVQGLMAPLMVLIMIPYFAILLLDLSSLPAIFTYIIYAIPFSHTFLAMTSLYLQNYSFVLYGIAYQAVVFFVFVWLAAWIFSTDKIITMRFSLKKRR